MKINIILGAGFSIPADFPSGKALNEKFFEKVENRILKHTSSEWFWDDYDNSASHNGRLNFDFLNHSYLLSELVEQYQIETSNIFDYEEFFDWFNSKHNNQTFWETCCIKVNERLISNYNLNKTSLHLFNKVDTNQYWKVFEIYNYLIADLLDREYLKKENAGQYTKFIELIKSSESANIFTLNHDTLVEFLLTNNQIHFSDGFAMEGSSIIGDDGERIPTFQEEYDSNINLFKLHGSVDYFRFSECNENGSNLTRTGNYWFIKPNGYYNKHHAKRIDNESGQVVQNYNPDIIPQFLTGKGKLEVIKDHLVYGPIYKRFKESFNDIDLVILIGYSYRDIHINSILKEALDNNNFKVININPSMEFPFRKNYSRDIVKEFKYLTEFSL